MPIIKKKANLPFKGKAVEPLFAKRASMYSDSETTVKTLKELLVKFRDERDWNQFHDPKNLAEAVSIEASELLELFLWTSDWL